MRGNNVGSDEQLEPICRLLNFAKAIAAFGNELGPAPTPIRLTIIRTNRGARTQDLSAKILRFGRFRKRREHPHDAQREILRALSQIDFRLIHSLS